MNCEHCPCPADCRRFPIFCEWAAERPPDPVKLRHICASTNPPKPAEYPPLAQQAADLAGSLWAWAVSGFSTATEEEVARRRALCAACAEWVAADRRCSLCGCQTDIKIRLKTEHCPLDRPRW